MEIVKFTKDNAFQRIKAWYLDEDSVELSQKDIERKDRLMHIHSLRRNNKYSPAQTIAKTISDFKVSQATAYRDYRLSMELFGNIDQANVDAERSVLSESYWNLYQMALKKGEIETARKCLDSYKSLFNFGEQEQKVDPKKLEASVYKMNLPRGAGKVLEAMMAGGVVDFNNITDEDVVWKEEVELNEEDDGE